MAQPALTAQRIASLLATSRYGRSLRQVDETESTNDDARRAAIAGAPGGHVVLAERQTRGRGSNGRSWTSPPGEDLYLSIVDRPSLALAQLPPLTLAVGLGVAEAVESVLGSAAKAGPASTLAARVKWPNDVLLGGRKCAGVLLEASSLGDHVDAVVIGIGLNVNRRAFPPELAPLATSLRLARSAASGGRLDELELDRSAVLAELLVAVERRVDQFVASGPAGLAEALNRRLAFAGQRMRCGDREGIVRAVSASGALLLETDRGVVELYAGRLEPL